MKLKQAAMFGLDARIALAIFGALSVISGAALYSAIQNAQVISVLNMFTEIHKAYEAFYIDTGDHVYLPVSGQDTIYIEELVNNTESRVGWKGPYLSYETSASRNGLVSKYNDDFILRLRSTEDWGQTAGYDAKACSSSDDCFVWIGLLGAPSEIANGIDEYVDGSIDDSTGKIRIAEPWGTGVALFYNTGISSKNY